MTKLSHCRISEAQQHTPTDFHSDVLAVWFLNYDHDVK